MLFYKLQQKLISKNGSMVWYARSMLEFYVQGTK